MACLCYREYRAGHEALKCIDIVNSIIQEYAVNGFDLTVRQVYYQFVSRGHSENSSSAYKRLTNIINKGRLGGLIDWDSIVDRTRFHRSNPHWEDEEHILSQCRDSFAVDTRKDQPMYVEVWVEKDVLINVVVPVCVNLDVPYLACRGFLSQSMMWRAALKFKSHERDGIPTILCYLGDHDPSGIDMTRDIQARMKEFGSSVQVVRLALDMDQIEKFNPPPNPVKLIDTRCADYIKLYGNSSWELDALDPLVLGDIIFNHVHAITDHKLRRAKLTEQRMGRLRLGKVVDSWDREDDNYVLGIDL